MRWFLVSNSNNRPFPLTAVSRVAFSEKMLMMRVKGISEWQHCSWKQLLTVTAPMLTAALLKAAVGETRQVVLV